MRLVNSNGNFIMKKAYSVLELSIVSVLAISILLMLSNWLGEIGGIAIDQAKTENEINSNYSIDLLEDDLLLLSNCSSYKPLISKLQYNQLDFNILKDSKYYNIRWFVDPTDESLYRASQEYSNKCELLGTEKKKFITANIVSGETLAPVFNAIYEEEVNEDEKYGTCLEKTMPRCKIKAISLNLVISEYAQKYAYHKTFILK